jgi:hypothetical protein
MSQSSKYSDARCNSNILVSNVIDVFQENEPYISYDIVGGGKKYVFNGRYIEKLLLSFETLIYEAMSIQERTLAEQYVLFLQNGITSNPSEIVLALDEHLGSL